MTKDRWINKLNQKEKEYLKSKWIKWIKLNQEQLEKTDKEYREAKGKKKENIFRELIKQLIHREKLENKI